MRARRHRDQEGSPRRRREDELAAYAEALEELLEHGSRNFRRYRKRAYLAFVALAAANALALYLVVHLGGQRRDDLTRETQRTAQQAQQACVRSRAIGPPLAVGLERHHILAGRPLRVFRSTIPPRC